MPYYSAKVQVRWVDLDLQGHVNNSLFVDYLQDARAQWLTGSPVESLLRDGVIVTRHELQYLAPLTYSAEPLKIQVGVTSLGGAKFELDYRLSSGGRDVARAHSVMCPFDFSTKQPRRLTGAERDYLNEFRVSAEPFRKLESPVLNGRGKEFVLYPRWSDVDRYGHVNNVRFFDYVQEARIAMTMEASPLMARPGTAQWDATASLDQGNYAWLVARQDLDFLAQMQFRTTPYCVLSAPTHLGSTSVIFAAEVVDPLADNKILARARTILVCCDENGTPSELSDDLRAALTTLLVGN